MYVQYFKYHLTGCHIINTAITGLEPTKMASQTAVYHACRIFTPCHFTPTIMRYTDAYYGRSRRDFKFNDTSFFAKI